MVSLHPTRFVKFAKMMEGGLTSARQLEKSERLLDVTQRPTVHRSLEQLYEESKAKQQQKAYDADLTASSALLQGPPVTKTNAAKMRLLGRLRVRRSAQVSGHIWTGKKLNFANNSSIPAFQWPDKAMRLY